MKKYKVKNIERKIALFDGRPDRLTVINEDDISNLKIALGTPAPKGHDPLYYFLANT
jgi:hypothetical protein